MPINSLQKQSIETNDQVWSLPRIAGRYYFDYNLSKITWFKVGGLAAVYFKPDDLDDLQLFLKNRDLSMPLTILGAASNVLIRDGGIDGVVIKLGKEFANLEFRENQVIVGAACLDRTFVLSCAAKNLTGIEFLIGVPGTIGGAIAMNAGAYGSEVKDFLEWVEVLHYSGTTERLSKNQLNMTYRHGNLPPESIVIRACFNLQVGDPQTIQNLIDDNLQKREDSQPVHGRTGGSTFKNPATSPYKAWELIDQAGCRGLMLNDAQVSKKHCNFLLNTNAATADELERVGEQVRQAVLEKTNIELEWEIIRLGKK